MVWVYICQLLYWHICSLMICMCLPCWNCAVNWCRFFFLGHRVQPEKNVPLFGLKVGYLWWCQQVRVSLTLISALYLATLQVIFHHLLCSYYDDDHTTNIMPFAFEWQFPGWNWTLITLLLLVVGCHILLLVSIYHHYFFSLWGVIN